MAHANHIWPHYLQNLLFQEQKQEQQEQQHIYSQDRDQYMARGQNLGKFKFCMLVMELDFLAAYV